MRYYLIILETLTIERIIEILDSTNIKAEAVDVLISRSDEFEEGIVAGKCKVYMTTYLDNSQVYLNI